ncbi:MAG: mycothiol synthase [Actinomycetota bacterium]
MAAAAVTTIAPDDFGAVVAEVRALDDAARAADGYPALGEAVWRDLEQPGADSAGACAPGVAYLHVARSDNFSPRHWVAGLVVHPDARGHAPVTALLTATVEHVAASGGGRLVLWVFGAATAADPQLLAAGFRPARELYEMRVPLPIAETAQFPPGIDVRTFEPGRDEDDWLTVNNRAFANHAEQGGWIGDTLERRMRERWFDPSIFLVASDADGLVGFNWCKMHDAHGRDPALGEIFVIGVDPRAAGAGLGRALALAGLARMAERGVTTGSLFCAADNIPALGLYRSLGFDVHRTDRAYELNVSAR